MRITNDDALPTAFDQTALLPGAERPAHGVQRGPGHLGDVLTADREIDRDAVIDLSAGLIGEPQQGMRDAALDLLRRHFHDPRVRLLQAAADRLKSFLEKVKQRYQSKVSDLSESWQGNTLSYSFSTFGFKIAGDLNLRTTGIGFDFKYSEGEIGAADEVLERAVG